MLRDGLILCLACLAAACGGHPTAAQPSTTFPLESGAYRLTLSMTVAGEQICTGAGCAAARSCVDTGGVQVASVSVPIDVRVERTGNDVAVHPVDASATFQMNVQISGAVVSGTASGEFRSGVVVVTDGGKPQSVAVVTGIAARGYASGTLAGAITFDGAGCSNNAHRWSLGPPLPF